MAVARGAVGGGNHSTGAAISWISNQPTTDAQTVAVVGVVISVSSNSSSTTCSVTYGGQAMTQRGLVLVGSFTSRAAVGLYTLTNPPSGSQTVTVTPGGSSTKAHVIGNSVCYTGAVATNYTSAAATGLTVTTVANGAAFCVTGNGAALSAPTQTSQYLYGASVSGVGDYCSIQDALSSGSSVVFANTGSNSTPESLGIALYPAIVAAPAGATLTWTGAAPIASTPVVVQPPAASLTSSRGTPDVAAPALVQPGPAGPGLPDTLPFLLGALSVIAGTPAVEIGAWITIFQGAPLAVTASAPTVDITGDTWPDPAALTVDAAAPVIAESIYPGAAAPAITGSAPDIVYGGPVAPAPAALAATTGAASIAMQIAPSGAILTAVGDAPTITRNVLVQPAGTELVAFIGQPTVTGPTSAQVGTTWDNWWQNHWYGNTIRVPTPVIEATATAELGQFAIDTDITVTATAELRANFITTATQSITTAMWGEPPEIHIDFDAPLLQQCEIIWYNVQRHIFEEERIRRYPPLTRLWDGQWNLHHVCSVEYKATWSWISNDTGPGQIEIPYDSPIAKWINDMDGRILAGQGRNIHVTVDYCGARWSGRMDKSSVEQREDGDTVLVVDFLHDYENLKWYTVWSNPFLPALFQFPRAFLLAGPVNWCLKLALFLQIFREHNPLITWPDDPLDLTEWFTSMNVETWNVVVKPQSFIESMESGVVWGILTARWTNWHDMAHMMLEDAQLSVQCERYLPGDDPPWPGAQWQLSYGTLVVDIVDKSGYYVGTANGGTAFDGLILTFVQFFTDFIDSTVSLVYDTHPPGGYYQPGNKFTHPSMPYVIYLEGDSQNNSPIQSSAFIQSPCKGVQVNTGGHSFPGINEVISASVQALFDILGAFIFLGGLGGIIDTLIKPLYEDVFLAWWSVKSTARARHSGWSRYFEYFQSGGGKAYTIASLFVLRAGFWATRTIISWKVNVVDGLPYMIGDRGLGHFFLDDRVGLILAGDENQLIYMDRCRKLDLAWTEEAPPEWTINIGDDRILEDPAQRAFDKIESLIAALKDLGVW